MSNLSRTLNVSKSFLPLVMAVGLLLAALPGRAHASELFLDLGAGMLTSTIKGFEKQGVITSFSFGARYPAYVNGGAPGRDGRPEVNELTVTRTIDGASAKIWQKLVENQVFATVTLTVSKVDAKGAMVKVAQIKLSSAVLTSYNVSGAGGNAQAPFESFSFAFSKIEYTPFDAGKAGAPVVYDLAEAQPL